MVPCRIRLVTGTMVIESKIPGGHFMPKKAREFACFLLDDDRSFSEELVAGQVVAHRLRGCFERVCAGVDMSA